jgi:HK97 gp10 family phage protein
VANRSGMEMDLKSYQSVENMLSGLTKKLRDSIADDVVMVGGEIIKQELENPVTGIKKSALKKEHANAHIVIKKTRTAGRITIEPDKGFYYLKFPERGTSSIAAQHNFERVATVNRQRVIQAMAREAARKLRGLK